MGFLDQTFLSNTILQWISAVVVVAGLMVVQRILRTLVARRIRVIALRTKNNLDDLLVELIENIRPLLILVIALYVGTVPLTLPGDAAAIIRVGAVLALLVQGALWAEQIIRYVLVRTIRSRGDSSADAAALTALRFISRLILWTLVLLLALQNMGVRIDSLIASLGIGGIAVALAVQNILGDLFASLTIMLDRPFVLGDNIVVDEFTGTVEHIGLKTTRLRSQSGEELVFGNADLLSSRIRNYKKMNERRVEFRVGVTYETPAAMLAQIPAMLEEIVSKQPGVRFDRAHFQAFGDFSLNFEVVYYMLDPDYRLYMDTQQAINYELFERFAAAGIDFAYPTQTVFMAQPPQS